MEQCQCLSGDVKASVPAWEDEGMIIIGRIELDGKSIDNTFWNKHKEAPGAHHSHRELGT